MKLQDLILNTREQLGLMRNLKKALAIKEHCVFIDKHNVPYLYLKNDLKESLELVENIGWTTKHMLTKLEIRCKNKQFPLMLRKSFSNDKHTVIRSLGTKVLTTEDKDYFKSTTFLNIYKNLSLKRTPDSLMSFNTHLNPDEVQRKLTLYHFDLSPTEPTKKELTFESDHSIFIVKRVIGGCLINIFLK